MSQLGDDSQYGLSNEEYKLISQLSEDAQKKRLYPPWYVRYARFLVKILRGKRQGQNGDDHRRE